MYYVLGILQAWKIHGDKTASPITELTWEQPTYKVTQLTCSLQMTL